MQSIEYGRIPIDARELATTFMTDKKWEIITQVWAEMLCHGAVNCKYDSHIRQLMQGGDFISQVWIFLLLHGLTGRSPSDALRPIFACTIKGIWDSATERGENGSEEDDKIYGGTSSDEEMDASWLEEGLINRSIHKVRSLPVEGTREQNGNSSKREAERELVGLIDISNENVTNLDYPIRLVSYSLITDTPNGLHWTKHE
ncbi:hypothetical protein LguiB_018589 [Lonicera macranthoides]